MKKTLPFLFLFVPVFSSCVGLSMDIQMRRDGSGRINLEYRISNMAETIGRLDGNENWPVIPLGRGDFERTTERIQGMKLASFSSRQTEGDLAISAALEFDSVEALLEFLDPFETSSSLDPLAIGIILVGADTAQKIDAALLEMVKPFFEGYSFAISFSAEGDSAMAVTDGAGKEMPAPQAAQVVQSGRRVSLSIGMSEIFSLENGLGLQFRR